MMEGKLHYLVTGTAGFIGFHLVRRLLAGGHTVTGIDQINDYYDPGLKYARLAETGIRREAVRPGREVVSDLYPGYSFYRIDLEDREALLGVFEEKKPDIVVNLAAQAGVRYSLTHPYTYLDSNILGFMNILEACRAHPVRHLVYASSSSVYGLNRKMPFSVHEAADHPVSLYAVTKKSNEMMAHSYSHLFGIPTTGLRFFTVYGPWGRPDMALFLFTERILAGRPIDVYNHGDMQRDFTYVDDIVEGVAAVSQLPPEGEPRWQGEAPDPALSSAPYRLLNIGNSRPVQLMDFIRALEQALGKKALLNKMPMQAGDVPATWADVSDLTQLTGYRPSTGVETGIERFVEWYREYYRIPNVDL